MNENNQFYVNVSDPVQLRRLLLESSKQILQSLQDYERIQSIREEKIKYIMRLRHTIKEIYTLNAIVILEFYNKQQGLPNALFFHPSPSKLYSLCDLCILLLRQGYRILKVPTPLLR